MYKSLKLTFSDFFLVSRPLRTSPSRIFFPVHRNPAVSCPNSPTPVTREFIWFYFISLHFRANCKIPSEFWQLSLAFKLFLFTSDKYRKILKQFIDISRSPPNAFSFTTQACICKLTVTRTVNVTQHTPLLSYHKFRIKIIFVKELPLNFTQPISYTVKSFLRQVM